MADELTVEQAFRAMRYFLAQYNDREPPARRESIEQLLQWTELDDTNGGPTFDPAQWEDWRCAVERALEE